MSANSQNAGSSSSEKETYDFVIFTTIANNYLSQASVLFNSINEHCYDVPFHCFITDGYDDILEIPENMRANVFDCRRLNIANFDEMSFKYSVTEFATSLKPHIFEYLFDKKAPDWVIFLDPDTKLYDSVDWIRKYLHGNSILLTPHILDSRPYLEPIKGRSPERDLSYFLRVGIYNTGFIAIRNDASGREFIRVWSHVLKDQCLQRYCYDQSWVVLLDSFFRERLGIVIDAGANVAYWNLHERTIVRNNDGSYLINGSRLKFMHFSKIEESFGIGGSIVGLPQNSSLLQYQEYHEIYEDYAKELNRAGFSERKTKLYRYDYFDSGVKIAEIHRRMYDHLLRGKILSNPFSSSGELYLELRSKKLLVPETRSRILPQRFLVRLIYRLFNSKVTLRFLFRVLGPKKYLSLFKGIDNIDNHASALLSR